MAEPVLIGGSIAAVLNFVVFFLLKQELDPGVQATIAAIATSLVGLIVRSRVTPT